MDMSGCSVLHRFEFATHDASNVSKDTYQWKHCFWINPSLFHDSFASKLFCLSSELCSVVGFPFLTVSDALWALKNFALSKSCLISHPVDKGPKINCCADPRLYILFRRGLVYWNDVTTLLFRMKHFGDICVADEQLIDGVKEWRVSYKQQEMNSIQYNNKAILPKLSTNAYASPHEVTTPPLQNSVSLPLYGSGKIGLSAPQNEESKKGVVGAALPAKRKRSRTDDTRNKLNTSNEEMQKTAVKKHEEEEDEMNEELGDNIYVVERIIGYRKRNKRNEYLILWENFPPSEATWEPRSHINVTPVLQRQMKEAERASMNVTRETGVIKSSKKPQVSRVRLKTQNTAHQKSETQRKVESFEDLKFRKNALNTPEVLSCSSSSSSSPPLLPHDATRKHCSKSYKNSLTSKHEKTAVKEMQHHRAQTEYSQNELEMYRSGRKRGSHFFMRRPNDVIRSIPSSRDRELEYNKYMQSDTEEDGNTKNGADEIDYTEWLSTLPYTKRRPIIEWRGGPQRSVGVIYKPPGWHCSDTVAISRTSTGKSLSDKLIKSSSVESLLEWIRTEWSPSISLCHRLDAETSGCMLIAWDKQSYEFVRNQFKRRAVGKEYIALVHGLYKPHQGYAIISRPILRHGGGMSFVDLSGEPAVTLAKPLMFLEHKKFGQKFTLVGCQILTGRNHQIRIHLQSEFDGDAFCSFPLVSDHITLGKDVRQDRLWCHRLFLHCSCLRFYPSSDSPAIEICSPLPVDLLDALSHLHFLSIAAGPLRPDVAELSKWCASPNERTHCYPTTKFKQLFTWAEVYEAERQLHLAARVDLEGGFRKSNEKGCAVIVRDFAACFPFVSQFKELLTVLEKLLRIVVLIHPEENEFITALHFLSNLTICSGARAAHHLKSFCKAFKTKCEVLLYQLKSSSVPLPLYENEVIEGMRTIEAVTKKLT